MQFAPAESSVPVRLVDSQKTAPVFVLWVTPAGANPLIGRFPEDQVLLLMIRERLEMMARER
jgi:hypothetical protein